MWKDQAKLLGARAIAASLGLDVCPVCEHRPEYPRRDRMGSVQWRDLGRWHCYACDAGGDAVALLAAVACGSTRPVTSDGWREAERIADSLGLTPGPARPAPRRPRYPLPNDGTARWLAASRLAEGLADALAEYAHEDIGKHRAVAWEWVMDGAAQDALNRETELVKQVMPWLG